MWTEETEVKFQTTHSDQWQQKQMCLTFAVLFTQAENKTIEMGKDLKELSQNKCTMPIIWRIKDPKLYVLTQ